MQNFTTKNAVADVWIYIDSYPKQMLTQAG